jgi:hypothetical protein
LVDSTFGLAECGDNDCLTGLRPADFEDIGGQAEEWTAQSIGEVDRRVKPLGVARPKPYAVLSSRSFGSHGLVEELNLAARVARYRKDLIELDLRFHAVALHDAVEPWPGVERLGVLQPNRCRCK